MSQIRDEFAKAWNAQSIEATDRDRMVAWGTALWAAKWMVERCAMVSENKSSFVSGQCKDFHPWSVEIFGTVQADEIRLISKELE